MQTFGSRAEVFHGTAMKTTGGLTKSDLVHRINMVRIVSKAARKAALARMKSEGKQHLVKVFKPKKSGFGLQPKEGTKKYKTLVKKML